jgi:hypothetical protein
MRLGKEEADKRLHYLYRAVLIGFQYTPEEIAAKKATGMTFHDLYKEARSPHAGTVAKQQAAASKDGNSEAASTPTKKGKATGWTAPDARGDSERTDEDMLDILDSYFGGSSAKIKIFMMKLLERSRVKAALIEIFKEQSL